MGGRGGGADGVFIEGAMFAKNYVNRYLSAFVASHLVQSPERCTKQFECDSNRVL